MPIGVVSAPLATAIENPLGIGNAQAAAAQQHGEVIDDVGRLLGDALIGLLASRPNDLLRLLLDLGSDEAWVIEALRGVRARGPGRRALGDRPLERRERLVTRLEFDVPPVKAGVLAGVTARTGRFDEREQRVGAGAVADRND